MAYFVKNRHLSPKIKRSPPPLYDTPIPTSTYKKASNSSPTPPPATPGFLAAAVGSDRRRPTHLRFRPLETIEARGRSEAMESEDDMHDTEDLESLDDFYSGGTGADSDDADDNYEFVDNDSDGSDDSICVRQQVCAFC